MSKISIAVATPTYNERDNIERLIAAVSKNLKSTKGVHLSLYVVDDSSPDGTADFVKCIQKNYKHNNFLVELVVRKKKEGLGKAYIDIFSRLIESGKYDYIGQMDADLSHDPKYINEFIEKAKADHDFIVASRYIKGGATPDWSLKRKMLSRGGNLYTSIFLGTKINDYTGGYNFYRTGLLKQVLEQPILATGYGFLIELKYRALLLSKKPTQIPIVFMDRTEGESKIPSDTLVKNLILVPKLWSGTVFHGEKARFVVAGGTNTLIDFAMLNVLFLAGLGAVVSNSISVSIGIVISYLLNHKFVFKHDKPMNVKAFAKFFAITGFSSLILQGAIIYAFGWYFSTEFSRSLLHTDSETLELNVAKVVAVAVGMVWNFMLYKYVVFKKDN